MIFKDGVKMQGAKPEIIIAMTIYDDVVRRLKGHEATITSVTDGKHKGLPHYLGYAMDGRTRDNNSAVQWSDEEKRVIAASVRDRLTDEYDVVIESTHIHIEFDPRG